MRTPKGTELPILKLKGKDYLEVKYRLVWFNEVKPDWSIETEAVAVTETSAYFKATIKDEGGRIRSTAHKFENKLGFPDFIEKAETGSIGRALAMIGFGTQFCGDELDEGERIVDSPVLPKNGYQESERLIANKAKRAALKDPIQLAPEPAEPPHPFQTRASAQPYGPPSISIPASLDDGEIGSYVFTFGKYKGTKMLNVDIYELSGYVNWLKTQKGTFSGRLRQEGPTVIKMIEEFLDSRDSNKRNQP